MLETTRIRREGYSFRPLFEDFMERFGLLAYGARSQVAPSAQTCSKVMQVSALQGWLMGRTKVFLKYWHVEQLDKQIRRFHDAAIICQKWIRRHQARKLRKKLQAKARENVKAAHAFFDVLARGMATLGNKISMHNAEDMRKKSQRTAMKAPVLPPKPTGPPKTEAELKREASIMWWKEKERPIGAGQDGLGNFLPWFHGLVDRKETERLLQHRKVGCFMIRVSENRFGYTLSYRVRDRVRHYIVEQDSKGRYALVGVDKITSSLNSLVDWFQKNRINAEGDMLRDPCGQEVDEFGEEQCDYGELLSPGEMAKILNRGNDSGNDAPPPPVTRGAKPGSFNAGPAGGAPPPRPASIGSRPAPGGGAPPPPVLSRGNKPTL
jgi:myosin-3